ncbi:MAG: hypothetical protein ACRC32_15080, partial [Chroococcidiopsis sp.]
RIDLAPFQSLVHFMADSAWRTVAGVQLMAFSPKQVEEVLENLPELKLSKVILSLTAIVSPF